MLARSGTPPGPPGRPSITGLQAHVALLAAHMIETCGEDLSVEVFHALGHPDIRRRATATAGLYWGHDSTAWPRLDAVMRLNRFEITRRAVVVGLADRLGLEAPRVIEDDCEYGRRRIRDAAFHRMELRFGKEPPSRRRARQPTP